MNTSGFYPDPFDKAFARYHNGEQWTYIISDSASNLRTDDEISNTALIDAKHPNEVDLLVGQPLRWAVAGVNRTPHSSGSETESNTNQFMNTSGFYPDPFDKAFARYHNGEQWTYIISDSASNLRTDDEISNTALIDAKHPNEVDLLVGQPLRWAVAGVNRIPHSSGSDISELSSSEGEWVDGFNSRVRLKNDFIEIHVEPRKGKGTLFLSSSQDILNEGVRTIPLRTIQAVHLASARRGTMGALQFTVPGALTQQHRDSAGKALKVLQMFGDITTQSQAHENSVSFEFSQQHVFEKFHSLVVERMNLISQTTNENLEAAPDFIAQLRELKSLVADGILTQAEFDSAKQEILKRI